MKRGWWTLETTVELNDNDRQHITELIADGFTSGEILQEEDDQEEWIEPLSSITHKTNENLQYIK
jgi:hypothetical protein